MSNATEKKPYLKLKAYFAENQIRHKDVAHILNMSPQTFSSKINRNQQDFTRSQIVKLCNEYNLDANQFFLD